MKFYKMNNGDIVTALHVSTTRPNAIRATRLFDTTHKQFCCQRRVYTCGVDARLTKAQTAVIMGQLNSTLREHTDGSDFESKLELIKKFATERRDIIAGWLHKRTAPNV